MTHPLFRLYQTKVTHKSVVILQKVAHKNVDTAQKSLIKM